MLLKMVTLNSRFCNLKIVCGSDNVCVELLQTGRGSGVAKEMCV